MQLAHAGNQGLAGLFVGLDAERRIFLRQALQGDAHFFLVSLGLRFDSLRDDGLGEHHALEHDDGIRITQGFARGHVFQTNAGGNVAGADFADFFAVVGVHLHDTADTLFLALDRVVDTVALFQDAGVHAHKGQLADKGVGHQLECQRREFLVVVGLAGHPCTLR
eukprot:Opistho-1_new@6882